MRLLRIAAAALAAAAIPFASAAAVPDNRFPDQLAVAIDRAMELPPGLVRNRAAGVVRIAFAIDPEGRTADVRIVESSGHESIDRAALRAVAGLDLPAGSPAGPHLAELRYGRGAGLPDGAGRR
jgi:TonB family protein